MTKRVLSVRYWSGSGHHTHTHNGVLEVSFWPQCEVTNGRFGEISIVNRQFGGITGLGKVERLQWTPLRPSPCDACAASQLAPCAVPHALWLSITDYG